MKFDENIPIYLQIKEVIENAIIGGTLAEEQAIPSIRRLAKEYRLNPQTISNAVNELINDGILYKKRGIGMFVKKEAQAMLIETKTMDFKEKELKKVITKSKKLGIKEDTISKIIKEIYEGGSR